MEVAKKIDQLFISKWKEGKFSGNILVAKGGVSIYTGTFGLSDYRRNSTLTIDSLFELASVTKPMTAIGIMILAEQSELHYDDPISKWIHDFPYPTVTLRHVLTHTSGLPDYMELFETYWDRTEIATNTDVFRLLATYKPHPYFNPEDKCEYSNTGYVCLATVIEVVSGMSYSSFMLHHVFIPAGMHRTRVMNRRFKPETVDDFAYGFIKNTNDKDFFLPDELPEYDYVNYLDGIQGDGMIHSTIMDLLSLDRALKEGILLSNPSLELSLSTFRTKDGQKTHCGFGWFIDHLESAGKRVSHSGGWPGYSTMLSRYPETDYTIIILTNVEYKTDDGSQERAGDLLKQIEECIF
ncbi:beta-lactamase family protein [Sporosarcina sp. ACRSM]|uniref:serine hydrolase domain-containing protein n=1 Tax=Sporosarcina sp. ACRSM TaxID=2918216 RepID=UPI001EF5BB05|nr:serine hydrolase domain-containing protein [Sporosarcina sp. ACRSM]MCG7337192.1 beta-lactamase family protein [Sporosarcina sp. ACRSM]